MRLTDARRLRDEIREAGLHCIVPLGHGPDGYFARIFSVDGPIDFRTRSAWLAHKRLRAKEQRDRDRAAMQLELRSRPRSPIEVMIDRACGLE